MFGVSGVAGFVWFCLHILAAPSCVIQLVYTTPPTTPPSGPNDNDGLRPSLEFSRSRHLVKVEVESNSKFEVEGE